MRASKYLGLRCLVLGICLFEAPWAAAGPVNTPGRAPFALAEANGDMLTWGDLKGVLYWLDDSNGERAAAIQLGRDSQLAEAYTGGLANRERLTRDAPLAIVCSNNQSAVFWPVRTPESPSGRWDILPRKDFVGVLRCSMTANGHYGRLAGGRLEVNGQKELTLPAGSSWREMIAVGDRFLLTDGRGAGVWLKSSDWTFSAVFRSSLLRLEESSYVVGRDFGLLRVDGLGTVFAAVQGDLLGPVQRLPAQPCDDGVRCGGSLAADGSWLVSGYWGHFLGKGTEAKRLNLPISVVEGHPVAIAHQSLEGRFVYLGGDDGDRGLLRNLMNWQDTTGVSPGERWIVWMRDDMRDGQAPLLMVPLSRPQEAWRQHQAQLAVRIWEGPLPEPIPTHWVTWEREQRFDATTPELASEGAGAWWRESLGIEAAHRLPAEAGVEPRLVHATVIDSGMDAKHPWLQQLRFRQEGEIPGNGRDDDGNGYSDDEWGYDFVDEDAWPDDAFGHGTHVAGLMMGQAPGDLGGAVAPNIRVTVIRALDRAGKSNSIDLLRALVYSAESGARLVNCSWGGGADTQALRDGFALLRARDIQVISSAGNDRLNNDQSAQVPKKYPGVVSVAAYDKAGRRADFSNFGRQSVAFATPGVDIESTIMGQGFGLKSGTSMAAPLLTAAWAYIYGILESQRPGQTQAALHQDVYAILCQTALRSGWDQQTSCGRLQLEKAVARALQSP
jgi:hypothetical protein